MAATASLPVLAQDGPAGRMAGCEVRANRYWQRFSVNGPCRSRAGHVVTLNQAEAPALANAYGSSHWLVLHDDARLEWLAEPPDPVVGPALLALVRPGGPGVPAISRGGNHLAHNAWLTLFPPIDDSAAQARAARFQSGAMRLPVKDFPVGCLGDTPLDLEQAPPPGTSWAPERRGFDISASGVELVGSVLRGGSLNYRPADPPYQGSRIGHSRILGVTLNRRVPWSGHAISGPLNASPARTPRGILLHDTTIGVAETGETDGLLRGLTWPGGDLRAERVLIERTADAYTHIGPGSVLIDCASTGGGYVEAAHSDTADMVWLPGMGTQAYGDVRFEGFWFDSPTVMGAPLAAGAGVAPNSVFALWGQGPRDSRPEAPAVPMRDVVFRRGYANGGARPVFVGYSYHRTGEIADCLIEDVAFGRDFVYHDGRNETAHGYVLNGLRIEKPRAPDAPKDWLKRLVIRDCFWADSGELIDFNGSYSTSPATGEVVRTA